MRMLKVISGGQTGADQGGLLGAVDAGFDTGGYAPKNFLTEKGPDPSLARFGMIDSGLDYVGRTRMNAAEADVTFWFGTGDSRGFFATRRECKNAGKSFVVEPTSEHISTYIKEHNCHIINIAGNRESLSPGTCDRVRKIIREVKV